MGACKSIANHISKNQSIILDEDTLKLKLQFIRQFKINPFFSISYRTQTLYEEEVLKNNLEFTDFVYGNLFLNDIQKKLLVSIYLQCKEEMENIYEFQQYYDLLFMNVMFFMLSAPSTNISRKELVAYKLINDSFNGIYKSNDLTRLRIVIRNVLETSLNILIHFLVLFLFIEETIQFEFNENGSFTIQGLEKAEKLTDFIFERLNQNNNNSRNGNYETVITFWEEYLYKPFQKLKFENNMVLLTPSMKEDIVRRLIHMFNPITLFESMICLRIPNSNMRII